MIHSNHSIYENMSKEYSMYFNIKLSYINYMKIFTLNNLDITGSKTNKPKIITLT